MSKYSTENLTPYAGGSTLVSHELLTQVIAEIDSMHPWSRDVYPALVKLRNEFHTVQGRLDAREDEDR